MAYFTKFIESLRKTDSEISDIVELLLTRGRPCELLPKNIFERATAQDIEHLRSKIPVIVNNQQTLSWPLVSSHFKSSNYLPIRAFRADPARYWQSVDNLRIFLSSGTSSSPEGRSRSCFSAKGLEFYRAGSIAAFFDILETRVTPFSGVNLNTVTVSLIPKKSEWPDSSLAQMVAWISDIWKTFYSENGDEQKIVECIDSAIKLNAPLVIFGTAFHFVNLFDAGANFKLPAGSIVIETGGTKGRSRSVTREELYQMLTTGFGIEPSAIVSEYGMCEIASPAWDIIPCQHNVDLSKRTFKFPWWVQIGSMTSASDAFEVGEGALVIDDPLRIDLPNLAIQTEDLVHIHERNRFQIMGRIPKAPLKGCSLRVKDLSADLILTTNSVTTQHYVQSASRADLEQNTKQAKVWIERLIDSEESIKLLAQELGNSALAKMALEDLSKGLPSKQDDYILAAMTSIGLGDLDNNALAFTKKWLMIAPASHSLALIQPLLAAMILGLELRIRLPEINNLKSDRTFLAYAVKSMSQHGCTPIVLDHKWRLGSSDLLNDENVLIFGDDETCHFMNSFAPGRVSSFGNAVSMSLYASQNKSAHELQKLWNDQIALHQRGCLSSRAVFVIGGSLEKVFADWQSLLNQSGMAPSGIRSTGEKAAHALEEVRYRQLNYRVTSGIDLYGNFAHIVAKEISTHDISMILSTELSMMDMIVPIFVLPDNTNELEVITEILKIAPLRSLAADAAIAGKIAALQHSQNSLDFPKDLRIVRHGNLGRPLFDGSHLAKAFFTTGFGNRA